jgi:hypothetical protein
MEKMTTPGYPSIVVKKKELIKALATPNPMVVDRNLNRYGGCHLRGLPRSS